MSPRSARTWPFSLVVVLPGSRAVLERLVTDLVDVTPDDAFEVLLVDTGAPPDVLEFVTALEGDVTLLRLPGATARQAEDAARARASGRRVVVVDASTDLHHGWLTDDAGAEPLDAGPPVLADLGPAAPADVRTLLRHLEQGTAGVGDLSPAAAERLRERLAMEEERRLLVLARHGRDVCWVDEDDPEPLVTVRVPTFNRGPMVAEVAIRSVLAQTYENWELVVVGDACDVETERAVRAVRDPRVRFFNLPVRGTYPSQPLLRWHVAGSAPVNFALDVARGSWIAPLDDDDAFTPDHVERLLAHAREHRLEFVWSVADMEVAPGVWRRSGSPATWRNPGRPGGDAYHVVHGSVLYSSGLRFMRYSNTSWKYQVPEPSDQNMWRRMAAIGVRMGFLDRVTYRHGLECPDREGTRPRPRTAVGAPR